MIEENIPIEQPEQDSPVVGYLKKLAARQDRAALAHLRRGLGRKPGESMEMYPYVGRFIDQETDAAHDRAVFLTAALFAEYPEAAQNARDLGRSVRLIAEQSDSIERRFVALLDADAEDLHYYLRQMVGLLKANGIALNWQQLFKDIRGWENPGRRVQRTWARSFWGSAESNKQQESENKGENNR